MKSYMILDLQYGSTGKGLLAGYLAKRYEPDVIATAWGPNAGHTFIDGERKYTHRMLANGIVSPNLKAVLIGPGSVIDLAILRNEIAECADLLYGKTIVIHPQAAIVLPAHVGIEKRNVSIGSTMKGTGAAVIHRIERNVDDLNTAGKAISSWWMDSIYTLGVDIFVSQVMYEQTMANAKVLQIEGAQGFSLSMYHGFYPYTTSRDVTPMQVLADCAVPYSIRPEVYGTLRTFPIRVANRYDEAGNMIGTSGPCYLDQHELDWMKDLNTQPELTTVTKLPRRVFTFSIQQLHHAVSICAPDKLFLNFANYMKYDDVAAMVKGIESESGIEVKWLGFGPDDESVYHQIGDGTLYTPDFNENGEWIA